MTSRKKGRGVRHIVTSPIIEMIQYEDKESERKKISWKRVQRVKFHHFLWESGDIYYAKTQSTKIKSACMCLYVLILLLFLQSCTSLQLPDAFGASHYIILN